MPPYRLDIPASSAASEKVSHCSTTARDGVIPGSILELPAGSVTDAPNFSLPVHRRKIWAAAALNVLWPDT
jgi:hypothetical protein